MNLATFFQNCVTLINTGIHNFVYGDFYYNKITNTMRVSANNTFAILHNTHSRKVFYKAKNLQLVPIVLEAGEATGEEIHFANDRLFRIESGTGKCIINGKESEIKGGDIITVPAGSSHNIINPNAHTLLKIYAIYAPSNHRNNTLRFTKYDSEISREKFDGISTD